jgi:hypothetical protein
MVCILYKATCKILFLFTIILLFRLLYKRFYVKKFTPVMEDVLRKYQDEDPSKDPAYIVFINDAGCKKSIK